MSMKALLPPRHPNPAQVAEALRAAAREVAKGWTRHLLQDPITGTKCAIGALRHVILGSALISDNQISELLRQDSRSLPTYDQAVALLSQVLEEQVAIDFDPSTSGEGLVATCNDLHLSQADVIAGMEKAAAKAEEYG